jgi:hypothetical protein
MKTKKDRKPTIYWQDLRCGYNERYDTHYENMPIFISAVYVSCGEVISKAAEVLGVSASSFHKQMKLYDIPRAAKGHRGFPEGLKAIWDIGNTHDMTAIEIAKATNFCRGYITALLKRYNRPYLKGVRRDSGMYNRIKSPAKPIKFRTHTTTPPFTV